MPKLTVAQLAEQTDAKFEKLFELLTAGQESSTPEQSTKSEPKARKVKLPSWFGVGDTEFCAGVTQSTKQGFVTIAKRDSEGSENPRLVPTRKDGKPTVHGVAVKAAIPAEVMRDILANPERYEALCASAEKLTA